MTIKKLMTCAVLLVAAVCRAACAAPNITEEQAKETAFRHAGLIPEQVQLKTLKFDGRDGRGEYSLLFYAGNEEFRYRIDAGTGEITGVSQDIGLNAEFYGGVPCPEGKRRAAAAALAKIPGAQQSDVKKLRLKRGGKGGADRYEGEIFYDMKDYKFEIDAESDEIIFWEIDY